MFSKKIDKNKDKLIKLFGEISRIKNIIEEELFDLGLFINNEEQRILIENRYIIRYKTECKRSVSLDTFNKYATKINYVRQHSI